MRARMFASAAENSPRPHPAATAWAVAVAVVKECALHPGQPMSAPTYMVQLFLNATGIVEYHKNDTIWLQILAKDVKALPPNRGSKTRLVRALMSKQMPRNETKLLRSLAVIPTSRRL